MSFEIAKGKGIKCNVVVSRARPYIINFKRYHGRFSTQIEQCQRLYNVICVYTTYKILKISGFANYLQIKLSIQINIINILDLYKHLFSRNDKVKSLLDNLRNYECEPNNQGYIIIIMLIVQQHAQSSSYRSRL